MDQKLYQRLEERIGRDHLRKRVGRQVESAAKFYAKGGYASFHLENVSRLHRFNAVHENADSRNVQTMRQTKSFIVYIQSMYLCII